MLVCENEVSNKKALPEESGTAFPCNDDLFVI